MKSIMALYNCSKNYDDIHFIIIDLIMPRLNGIELVNIVRAYSKTVKILMITAFVVDDTIKNNDFKKA